MEIEREEVVSITLRLTEEEAEWLRGLVQNPIGVLYPQDESARDRGMRTRYWEALSGQKVPAAPVPVIPL